MVSLSCSEQTVSLWLFYRLESERKLRNSRSVSNCSNNWVLIDSKFSKQSSSIQRRLRWATIDFDCFWQQLTCLCAYTTLPRSFQVPPRRSIRTIRRIWKKRSPRSALVANTCPDVPIPITINDAAIVTMSERKINVILCSILPWECSSHSPIIQNGLLRNFRRPMPPWYLERHPDDHSLENKPKTLYIQMFAWGFANRTTGISDEGSENKPNTATSAQYFNSDMMRMSH